MRGALIVAAVAGVALAATMLAPPPVTARGAEAAGRGSAAAGAATVRGGGDRPAPPVAQRLPPWEQPGGASPGPAVEDGAQGGEIDAGQRVALREAGWAVPAELAGTWVLRHARVLTRPQGDAGTLQLVYTRGRRTLSLFERATPLDWSSVPDGHAPVPELPGDVREWPGAEPARLLWEAEGRTFVLIGEVGRPALLEAAASLPAAETEGLWHRLRRGMSELLARLPL